MPTSTGPSIAVDDAPGIKQVVLFGGAHNGASTWLWSGQRWGLAQPTTSPPGRENAAVAYDPVTRDVLMFGGSSTIGSRSSAGLDDTWAWNGCTWSRLAAHAQPPPGWLTPAMAWDQAVNQMVLLTAGGSSGSDATETWIWGGSRWSLTAPATSSPPAHAAVMAFDPVMNAVIALTVGGAGDDPFAPSATWWWDGRDWHPLKTAHSPAAGFPSALALDPLTNRLLLTGPSRTRLGAGTLTWEWGGGDWVPLRPASQPPFPAVAVDNLNDGVAEAFGWDANGPSVSPALHAWAWSGNAWVRLADGGSDATIPGTSPPAR